MYGTGRWWRRGLARVCLSERRAGRGARIRGSWDKRTCSSDMRLCKRRRAETCACNHDWSGAMRCVCLCVCVVPSISCDHLQSSTPRNPCLPHPSWAASRRKRKDATGVEAAKKGMKKGNRRRKSRRSHWASRTTSDPPWSRNRSWKPGPEGRGGGVVRWGTFWLGICAWLAA